MPITRPEPPHTPTRAQPGRLATALALLLALGGCTLDHDSRPEPGGELRERVSAEMTQVLRWRARGLREGDRRAFWRSVDASRPGARRRADMIFANYAQLPVGELRYEVDPASVARARGGWRAVVTTHLRLAGYDAAPAASRTVFRFRRHDGALRIIHDRARRGDTRAEPDVQPWDSRPVVVHSGRGVLGVFDEASAARAADVVHAVEAGISDVSDVVPLDWSETVVVYALSGTRLLSTLDVAGGRPEHLDAVTFPVRAEEAGARLAGTRFVLHPRMLERGSPQLDRLVRHELTHVALGERDDDVPTWLSEGIAEWVSVRPTPSRDRLISRASVVAARAGPASLPTDAHFEGPAQRAHYGLSWWAVEVIVERRGEPTLWRLLEALGEADSASHSRVLERTLRMGERLLAREAAKRIVETYG